MQLLQNRFMALLVLPVCLAIILTFPFYIWNIDVEWARNFYQNGRWLYGHNWFVRFLYDYGPVPAIASTVAGFVLFITSFFIYQFRKYRRIGGFLVLFLVIGSGVMVNVIFKEYWGRPRPRQIVEFGGVADYIPPGKRGPLVLTEESQKLVQVAEGEINWENLRNIAKLRGKYNSFPAGHASVGFFMMFPFFFLRSRKGRIFWMSVGISYGMLMGVVRSVQGAHFLSDVIWAGFMMYFTGVVLQYFMFRKKRDKSQQATPPIPDVTWDGSSYRIKS
ncbi:MAG: phosphatase PAP2 family protein [Desulfobulbaceae bacterium]|nr:MAG: phosphatase PAP2 family protein [Desulfobulbaceae bacterium]